MIVICLIKKGQECQWPPRMHFPPWLVLGFIIFCWNLQKPRWPPALSIHEHLEDYRFVSHYRTLSSSCSPYQKEKRHPRHNLSREWCRNKDRTVTTAEQRARCLLMWDNRRVQNYQESLQDKKKTKKHTEITWRATTQSLFCFLFSSGHWNAVRDVYGARREKNEGWREKKKKTP